MREPNTIEASLCATGMDAGLVRYDLRQFIWLLFSRDSLLDRSESDGIGQRIMDKGCEYDGYSSERVHGFRASDRKSDYESSKLAFQINFLQFCPILG